MSELSKKQLAGKNLRRLIKESGRTQQDFADEFGTDIRNVNRYINEGISKVEVIQEIAEFFKVDFGELFMDE